jgi:hypothetical protein
MPKPEKLGRNPLSRLKGERPLRQAHDPVLRTEVSPFDTPSTLERIHEMQIQIDWREFIDTAFTSRIKKLTRLFS